jgi:hypothetical protein
MDEPLASCDRDDLRRLSTGSWPALLSSACNLRMRSHVISEHQQSTKDR